jgi:hypothetical protein
MAISSLGRMNRNRHAARSSRKKTPTAQPTRGKVYVGVSGKQLFDEAMMHQLALQCKTFGYIHAKKKELYKRDKRQVNVRLKRRLETQRNGSLTKLVTFPTAGPTGGSGGGPPVFANSKAGGINQKSEKTYRWLPPPDSYERKLQPHDEIDAEDDTWVKIAEDGKKATPNLVQGWMGTWT